MNPGDQFAEIQDTISRKITTFKNCFLKYRSGLSFAAVNAGGNYWEIKAQFKVSMNPEDQFAGIQDTISRKITLKIVL
jgi:hypothetical protein